MDVFTALFVSVVANIATYYICKWLDRKGGN